MACIAEVLPRLRLGLGLGLLDSYLTFLHFLYSKFGVRLRDVFRISHYFQNHTLLLAHYYRDRKKNVTQLLSFFMIHLGFLQCVPKPWGNSHLLKQWLDQAWSESFRSCFCNQTFTCQGTAVSLFLPFLFVAIQSPQSTGIQITFLSTTEHKSFIPKSLFQFFSNTGSYYSADT